MLAVCRARFMASSMHAMLHIPEQILTNPTKKRTVQGDRALVFFFLFEG
jgi:hypothetical protein